MRALAFSILSLLTEAAAGHLGAPIAGFSEASGGAETHRDLTEARLAIDAANALLAALRTALDSDERLAIESLLTQLQIEYVKQVS